MSSTCSYCYHVLVDSNTPEPESEELVCSEYLRSYTFESKTEESFCTLSTSPNVELLSMPELNPNKMKSANDNDSNDSNDPKINADSNDDDNNGANTRNDMPSFTPSPFPNSSFASIESALPPPSPSVDSSFASLVSMVSKHELLVRSKKLEQVFENRTEYTASCVDDEVEIRVWLSRPTPAHHIFADVEPQKIEVLIADAGSRRSVLCVTFQGAEKVLKAEAGVMEFKRLSNFTQLFTLMVRVPLCADSSVQQATLQPSSPLLVNVLPVSVFSSLLDHAAVQGGAIATKMVCPCVWPPRHPYQQTMHQTNAWLHLAALLHPRHSNSPAPPCSASSSSSPTTLASPSESLSFVSSTSPTSSNLFSPHPSSSSSSSSSSTAAFSPSYSTCFSPAPSPFPSSLSSSLSIPHSPPTSMSSYLLLPDSSPVFPSSLLDASNPFSSSPSNAGTTIPASGVVATTSTVHMPTPTATINNSEISSSLEWPPFAFFSPEFLSGPSDSDSCFPPSEAAPLLPFPSPVNPKGLVLTDLNGAKYCVFLVQLKDIVVVLFSCLPFWPLFETALNACASFAPNAPSVEFARAVFDMCPPTCHTWPDRPEKGYGSIYFKDVLWSDCAIPPQPIWPLVAKNVPVKIFLRLLLALLLDISVLVVATDSWLLLQTLEAARALRLPPCPVECYFPIMDASQACERLSSPTPILMGCVGPLDRKDLDYALHELSTNVMIIDLQGKQTLSDQQLLTALRNSPSFCSMNHDVDRGLAPLHFVLDPKAHGLFPTLYDNMSRAFLNSEPSFALMKDAFGNIFHELLSGCIWWTCTPHLIRFADKINHSVAPSLLEASFASTPAFGQWRSFAKNCAKPLCLSRPVLVRPRLYGTKLNPKPTAKPKPGRRLSGPSRYSLVDARTSVVGTPMELSEPSPPLQLLGGPSGLYMQCYGSGFSYGRHVTLQQSALLEIKHARVECLPDEAAEVRVVLEVQVPVIEETSLVSPDRKADCAARPPLNRPQTSPNLSAPCSPKNSKQPLSEPSLSPAENDLAICFASSSAVCEPATAELPCEALPLSIKIPQLEHLQKLERSQPLTIDVGSQVASPVLVFVECSPSLRVPNGASIIQRGRKSPGRDLSFPFQTRPSLQRSSVQYQDCKNMESMSLSRSDSHVDVIDKEKNFFLPALRRAQNNDKVSSEVRNRDLLPHKRSSVAPASPKTPANHSFSTAETSAIRVQWQTLNGGCPFTSCQRNVAACIPINQTEAKTVLRTKSLNDLLCNKNASYLHFMSPALPCSSVPDISHFSSHSHRSHSVDCASFRPLRAHRGLAKSLESVQSDNSNPLQNALGRSTSVSDLAKTCQQLDQFASSSSSEKLHARQSTGQDMCRMSAEVRFHQYESPGHSSSGNPSSSFLLRNDVKTASPTILVTDCSEDIQQGLRPPIDDNYFRGYSRICESKNVSSSGLDARKRQVAAEGYEDTYHQILETPTFIEHAHVDEFLLSRHDSPPKIARRASLAARFGGWLSGRPTETAKEGVMESPVRQISDMTENSSRRLSSPVSSELGPRAPSMHKPIESDQDALDSSKRAHWWSPRMVPTQPPSSPRDLESPGNEATDPGIPSPPPHREHRKSSRHVSLPIDLNFSEIPRRVDRNPCQWLDGSSSGLRELDLVVPVKYAGQLLRALEASSIGLGNAFDEENTAYGLWSDLDKLSVGVEGTKPIEIPRLKASDVIFEGPSLNVNDVSIFKGQLVEVEEAIAIKIATVFHGDVGFDTLAEAFFIRSLKSKRPQIGVVNCFGVAAVCPPRTGIMRPCILLEWCDHTLEHVIQSSDALWTSLPVRMSLAIQLAQAVHDIHESGVVHRNIKPSNILVTKQNKILLSNFRYANTTLNFVTPGQAHFRAPELDSTFDTLPFPADVFALARVVACLIAKRLPRDDESETISVRAISRDLHGLLDQCTRPIGILRSRRPDSRHFVGELQEIERELQKLETPNAKTADILEVPSPLLSALYHVDLVSM